MAMRSLTRNEYMVAKSVFRDSMRYDNVLITDTSAGDNIITVAIGMPNGDVAYFLTWRDGYASTQRTPSLRATFIHEMTHVWQGNNGKDPAEYMRGSAKAQLKNGFQSIYESSDWGGILTRWSKHRDRTYWFDVKDIGRDWKSFNVEQQASIVESWYVREAERHKRFGWGVAGGGASSTDPRFPYIRDVIRARDPGARYRPVVILKGADPSIRAIQDRLVELGYLDERHADGVVGRSVSPTRDAIRAFQIRNGLMPDGDFGGPRSDTRQRLALPADRLRRAR